MNVDISINYPTADFTLNDLVASYPTVVKTTIRARVNADLKKGTLKITGKKKVTSGRGRPSVVYAKS